MKIILLDFDGCIINRASYRLPGSGSADHAIAHPDCVAALNTIVKETGAYIVVSSVWRGGGIMSMKGKLRGWGVRAVVLDCTPDFSRRDDYYGKRIMRGDEIQEWLDKRQDARGDVESFVILDDDTDMHHLMSHLVRTDTEIGLTVEDATRAIAMLKNEG